MSGVLAGRTALVTGGARGIGAAIARRLAVEGAAVAITYSASKQEAAAVVADIAAAGGRAVAIHADSADREAVREAVERTVTTFGGIDVLVNNAGYAVYSTIEQVSDEDFDRIVAVNLRAVFVAAQAALPHMDHGGRIITIGSIFADRVPVPEITTYTLTKAALNGFTRGLARELGDRGITVNTVQPGPFATDANPPESDLADMMKKLTPAGRYASPEEITGLVVYLAGPESSFVTGASINIDGGFSV